MKHTGSSICSYIDGLTMYLRERGCEFNKIGFPLLEPTWFMTDSPTCMTTFRDRKASFVTDPSDTLLCFYSDDRRIYPRFDKLGKEIDIYQSFLGVVGPDLTVTPDMDPAWQREIILANHLFEAMLGINGVKIVHNLRIGSEETLDCLRSVPIGVPCATGTLGCRKGSQAEALLFCGKLLTLRPSIVYIYGKSDALMEKQFDITGVPFRRFPDAHAMKRLAYHSDHA